MTDNRTAPTFRYFLVTYDFQYKAWDEQEPKTERVSARDNNEAIRRMRSALRNRGYLACDTGRITFRCKLDPDQTQRDSTWGDV